MNLEVSRNASKSAATEDRDEGVPRGSTAREYRKWVAENYGAPQSGAAQHSKAQHRSAPQSYTDNHRPLQTLTTALYCG